MLLGRYIYLSVRGPALLGLYTYLYEDQRGHAIAHGLPLCTVAGGYGPVHCHDPSSTGGKPLSCAGCVLKCLFKKCVVNRLHIFLLFAHFGTFRIGSFPSTHKKTNVAAWMRSLTSAQIRNIKKLRVHQPAAIQL